MTKKTELTPWQRLVADRALGVEREPEERQELLAEARTASRPAASGWTQQVAERAMEQRQPREGGQSFEEVLRLRLTGGQGAEAEPPDAA
jgi:hypothetical protein